MKRKVMIITGILLAMVLCSPLGATASDDHQPVVIDFQNNVENHLYQYQTGEGGGGGSYTNPVTSKSKTEYRTKGSSTMSAIPSTPHHLSPRALHDPGLKRTPWREVRKVRFSQLYHNMEELKEMLKKDGDIVQRPKVAYSVGQNADDIVILHEIPQGENDQLLLPLVLDTPDNGMTFEGVIRAVSLVKHYTGTRRVLISTESLLNSINASSASAINAGISPVFTDASGLFSSGRTDGGGEALVYKRTKIYVYAYNNGSSTSRISQPAKNPQPAKEEGQIISFPFANLMTIDNPGFKKVAQKINNIWRGNGTITIQGKGIEGVDSRIIEESTINASAGIARQLIEINSPHLSVDEVYQIITYETGVLSDPRFISPGTIGRIFIIVKR